MGFSLAQATMGALASPPQAAMSALDSPGTHGAATYSRPLISKMVLAACPQGLGMPFTSTIRRPGWSMISSKLRYSSIAFSSAWRDFPNDEHFLGHSYHFFGVFVVLARWRIAVDK